MAAIPTALNFNNSSVLMYGELLPSWKNPFKYYFGNMKLILLPSSVGASQISFVSKQYTARDTSL